MFRALILTAAVAIGLTAMTAEAGNLKINFGGGGSNCSSGHCNPGYNGNRNNYTPRYTPRYAPSCQYKVCYYKPCWGYKKHQIFHSYYAAKDFAYQLQCHGYRVSISKYHGGHY